MLFRYLVAALLLFSTAHGKIYDCFMFFNEWEVLEIRLNELYDHVDKFVLVEAAESHRLGLPKPYYFEEEKHRFAPFLDKIIHIKLDEHVESDGFWTLNDQSKGWERENWQRNQIMRGLVDCQPNDLILISDVDEIIPAKTLPLLYRASATTPFIGFWQKMYRWYLNRSTNQVWAGTAALRYKHLVKICPQEVRNRVRGARMTMWHSGWHFTSMGGFEKAFEKYYSVVEGYDYPFTYEDWRAQVEAHCLVPIDRSYPEFIQENITNLIGADLIDTPLYSES